MNEPQDTTVIATTRRRFHAQGVEWIGHSDFNPRPDAFEFAHRFNAYPELLEALQKIATADISDGMVRYELKEIARAALEEAKP